MNTEDVLDVFRQCGAMLEGHFILTSGLHSPVFLQKARVFMHADKTEILLSPHGQLSNASRTKAHPKTVSYHRCLSDQ